MKNQVENECFPRKRFRWKRDNLEVTREVKHILKVYKQFDLEDKEEIEFPLA